ncbi:MAG TPA: hypothetical protein VMW75_27260 [Thermoanaerobaculia bacterium]|nr:hypothetical protein [Thermoanaerobaculia bacterium]
MAWIKKLYVPLSSSELVRLAAAAEAAAMPVAAWVRHQALLVVDAARKPLPLSPAALPERPPSKLTRRVGTYFTEEQFEVLGEHARACGLTVSCFTRHLILGFKPIVRRPLARSAIVALNRAGASLNQLVQLTSKGIVLTPDLTQAVAGVLEEIHALRDALLRVDATDTRKRTPNDRLEGR